MNLIRNKITKKRLRGYLIDSRGQVALIVTFIIMFLLISTAVYLTNANFKNFEVAEYTNKSSKAFYAAESGIEVFAYEKYKGIPFVMSNYFVGDILVCGCIDTGNNLVVGMAPGSGSATCGSCDANNMRFNVEKITNADNNKVKSTGGYQVVERAIRIQW